MGLFILMQRIFIGPSATEQHAAAEDCAETLPQMLSVSAPNQRTPAVPLGSRAGAPIF
jgi:hypothetical protein